MLQSVGMKKIYRDGCVINTLCSFSRNSKLLILFMKSSQDYHCIFFLIHLIYLDLNKKGKIEIASFRLLLFKNLTSLYFKGLGIKINTTKVHLQ